MIPNVILNDSEKFLCWVYLFILLAASEFSLENDRLKSTPLLVVRICISICLSPPSPIIQKFNLGYFSLVIGMNYNCNANILIQNGNCIYLIYIWSWKRSLSKPIWKDIVHNLYFSMGKNIKYKIPAQCCRIRGKTVSTT